MTTQPMIGAVAAAGLNKTPVPIGTIIYPSDVQVLDFGEPKIYFNFDQVPPCESNAAFAVQVHRQAAKNWTNTGDYFKSDGTACRNFDVPARVMPGGDPPSGGQIRLECVPLEDVPESIRSWVK